MYIFKKADITFLDILQNLMKDTFIQAYENIHSEENIVRYLNKNVTTKLVSTILSSETFSCTIVFKRNKPLGFFILKDKECPFNINNTSLELKQLYILKSEYNIGLGKVLFTNAVKITKTLSKKYIWITVSDSNIQAKSFYEKTGFKKLGRSNKISVGTDTLSSTVMIYKI